MITEDYVSFETAKLLKEKGFDLDTYCYYIEDSVEKTLFRGLSENHNAIITNNEFDIFIRTSSMKMSAPTLQMAMKWLRKNKNLFIAVDRHYFVIDKFSHISSGFNYSFEIKRINSVYREEKFKSYEEACEAAIKYCLENLI